MENILCEEEENEEKDKIYKVKSITQAINLETASHEAITRFCGTTVCIWATRCHGWLVKNQFGTKVEYYSNKSFKKLFKFVEKEEANKENNNENA